MTATAWRSNFAAPAARRISGSGDRLAVVLAFLVAHAALGLVCHQFRVAATIHGAIVVLVGIGVALTARRVDRVVAYAAYVAMCDVFWRMTKSQMPWEAAKYTTTAILLIAFIRFVKRPKHIGAPVSYFVLLLPACALSIALLPSGEARSQIAANLAGPMLLAVSVALFRQITSTDVEVTRMLWIMLGPITAIATIASRSTSDLSAEAFGSESNFATTGGFGPNQVSMILGLGALICVVWGLQRISLRTILLPIVLAGWYSAQAALTLSRGGLYGAAAGVAALVVVALTSSGLRSRVLVGLAVGVVIFLVAFPYLNSFTDGSLETRFQNTESSNRSTIASADIDLFEREPLLGVGVGVAKYERASTETAFQTATKAHTEYTRMLGEHGVLGLVAAVLLIVMTVQAIRLSVGKWNRLYAAAFTVWSLVSMTHSATAIAAIGFVFGLASLRSSDSADAGAGPRATRSSSVAFP